MDKGIYTGYLDLDKIIHMQPVIITLVVLLVPIVALGIWNTLNLKKISRYIGSNQIADARYFELKYKLEYIIAISSVVTVVATFLGYNINQNIQESVQIATKSVTELTDSIRYVKDQLQQYKDSISSVKFEADGIDNEIKDKASRINDIDYRIKQIEQKDVIIQRTYVVSNIKYSYSSSDSFWRVHKFEDYRTISGQPLPKFKKRPFVSVVSNEGALVQVRDVTTQTFSIQIPTYSDYEPPGGIFTLVAFIYENP